VHILVLCHEFPPIGGGAAAVCAALSREYRKFGASVTVLTMASVNLTHSELWEGVEVVRVSCGRKRKEMASPWEGLIWAWRSLREARKLHKRTPFNVIHAHFIMPAGIVAKRMMRSEGIPYLITPHGSDVPGYNKERLKLAHLIARPWWLRICHGAEVIISPSASLLQLLESGAGKLSAKIIPNGFEPGRFSPQTKKKEILLCSRLVERKGFHHFLEAIRDMDLSGWTINIVGDGPMFNQLQELAHKSRSSVCLQGWIDNDDPKLANLYGRAAIFVLPSEQENFSIALLEAMSAGCAIVTTNIGGNLEVLGDTGFLLTPGDHQALRAMTVELTRDLDRCVEIGRGAAERADKYFPWANVASAYLEVLRDTSGGMVVTR
jgi:glycosyltransferase involved in cell wall biosynthesis